MKVTIETPAMRTVYGCEAGQPIDLDDTTADDLVARGIARPVVDRGGSREAAVVAPAEKAVTAPAKPRKNKR